MPGFQASVIKNIIFDLGGVLLNINPLLSLNEFANLSGMDAGVLRNRLANEKIFEKFDTGSLSPEKFRSELCRIMNCSLPDSEIDRAWNILLLDFPLQRVQLLQQLNKNYRVFLLSNTNIIHYQYYTREFYEKYNFPMTDLFDTLFLSYEIGIHKPDAGIYKYVIKNGGLEPSESIFIDDSLINIEAAELQGIKSIHILYNEVNSYFESGYLKTDLLNPSNS
jgi:putative hydrolase of the HAD superfamily